MNKVITMVLYNRPDYTRTVLQALSECDGVEDYLLLPHIDPGSEEVLALAQAIAFAETRVTVNNRRLGCGLNTFMAWQDGFTQADFIVHIEDDTVPARDCLRYMEHCSGAYGNDLTVFSVSSYNREPCAPANYYRVGRRSAYTCWLIGVWQDRWLWAKDHWNPDPNRYATHLAREVQQMKWQETYPLLSRSQNIGAERGLHVHSAAWHHRYHHTEHWAGTFNLPSGDYHE